MKLDIQYSSWKSWLSSPFFTLFLWLSWGAFLLAFILLFQKLGLIKNYFATIVVVMFFFIWEVFF